MVTWSTPFDLMRIWWLRKKKKIVFLQETVSQLELHFTFAFVKTFCSPPKKLGCFIARISSNCISSSTGCSPPLPSPVCLFKVWPLCYTCVHWPPSLESNCCMHLCMLAASCFLNVLINYYRFCLPLWEIECLLCCFCVARESREGFPVNTGLNLRLRVTV